MAIRILAANDGSGENAAVAEGVSLYVGIVARHSYRCKPCVVEGILLDTAHAGRNVYRLHLRLVSESPFAYAHHLIRHATVLHHAWNFHVTAVVAFQFARQFNGVTTQNLVVQLVLRENKSHIASPLTMSVLASASPCSNPSCSSPSPHQQTGRCSTFHPSPQMPQSCH